MRELSTSTSGRPPCWGEYKFPTNCRYCCSRWTFRCDSPRCTMASRRSRVVSSRCWYAVVVTRSTRVTSGNRGIRPDKDSFSGSYWHGPTSRMICWAYAAISVYTDDMIVGVVQEENEVKRDLSKEGKTAAFQERAYCSHILYLHTHLTSVLHHHYRIMTASGPHSLVARGVQLYQTFMSNADHGTCDSLLQEWLAFERAIALSLASNALDVSAISAIASIAANVRSSASGLLSLQQETDQVVDSLAQKFREIAVDDVTGKQCLLGAVVF
jgi:hypothetical protein